MVDTTVVTDAFGLMEEYKALWGPYWIDPDTAVIVYMDANQDPAFMYTDDGGATWAKTILEAATMERMACWFDKETPGDDGNLVHVAYLDSEGGAGSGELHYSSIDVQTSGPTAGTLRTIKNTLTVSAIAEDNRICMTKAVNGRIIIGFETPTEIGCVKSAELAAPYFAAAETDIDDVFEAAGNQDNAMMWRQSLTHERMAARIEE